MSRSSKEKKCKAKGCTNTFQPYNSLQKWCSPECGVKLAREAQDKAFKKETVKRKAELKPRSKWLKEAQATFNAYIRERDAGEPCISCGGTWNKELITGSGWDCGHYRSVGANPELRFEELNCHKQCVYCNRNLSGNIVNYRIGLEKKIGKETLEWLEGPHEAKKYTIDDLKLIKSTYLNKLKELRGNERD